MCLQHVLLFVVVSSANRGRRCPAGDDLLLWHRGGEGAVHAVAAMGERGVGCAGDGCSGEPEWGGMTRDGRGGMADWGSAAHGEMAAVAMQSGARDGRTVQ
jgi:hypothetical protein